MPDNPLAALRSRLAELFRWLRETTTGKPGQDAEKFEAAGKCPPCAGRSERVAGELGAQDGIRNLLAVVMMILNPPFRICDLVRFGGYYGEVVGMKAIPSRRMAPILAGRARQRPDGIEKGGAA